AQWYEQAIAALDRQGEGADQVLKLDACLELWVALVESGQVTGFEELAQCAERLATELGDRPRLAQVRLREAQPLFVGLREEAGSPKAAIVRAQEALNLADPSDLRTAAYARFVASAARIDRGEFREAIADAEEGLALFGSLAPSRETQLTLPIYVSLRA